VSKQLLIYGNAQSVSNQRHLNWSIKVQDDYNFASEANSLPLTAVEFAAASEDFPIVFAGKDDKIMPVVVMGVRDNQNLFVAEDGSFDSSYVPAFLRRYPFVFSSSDDGANFTLCLDEAFEGCNQDGKGERLFDADGEQTVYLKQVLEFLKEYQAHFARTEGFCSKLNSLGLLEPVGAEFTPVGSEEKIKLGGFMAVNREKLKAISSEDLAQLFNNDGLELIYTHLASMRNFSKLVNKMPAVEAEHDDVA
jgi:hypothetical protein